MENRAVTIILEGLHKAYVRDEVTQIEFDLDLLEEEMDRWMAGKEAA